MSANVLLVEDSPGDVRLTQEAFRDADSSIALFVATDGVEAMAFLKHEGDHIGAPRPDLILLDLNLPRMDGREVLMQIKGDEALKAIPTVILTTSVAEADIVECYQLSANCYLSKPVQLDRFESLVRSINDFWLTKARLPQHQQAWPSGTSIGGTLPIKEAPWRQAVVGGRLATPGSRRPMSKRSPSSHNPGPGR